MERLGSISLQGCILRQAFLTYMCLIVIQRTALVAPLTTERPFLHVVMSESGNRRKSLVINPFNGTHDNGDILVGHSRQSSPRASCENSKYSSVRVNRRVSKWQRQLYQQTHGLLQYVLCVSSLVLSTPWPRQSAALPKYQTNYSNNNNKTNRSGSDTLQGCSTY